MEGSGCTSRMERPRARSGSSKRRYWTNAEEAALIASVKELVADGWRSGNGWKCGFYKKVEKLIQSILPGSTIKGEPHILSKLTVWKREYYLVSGLFGKSGQGLDPRDHTINIVGTQTWEDNVKLNPELEKMRGKSFPYYNDWCTMFGKDRANGEGAEDVGAAVQEILNEENAGVEQANIDPVNVFDFEVPTEVLQADDDTTSAAANSNVGNNNVAGSTMQQAPKRRRTSSPEADDPLVGMVDTLICETKGAISELSKAITSLNAVDPAVANLYAALESLPGFTASNLVVVANKIAALPNGVTIFFSMGIEARSSFVRSILDGEI